MKKMPLIVCALLMASITHAQIEKGNMLVGGSLGNMNIGLGSGGGFGLALTPTVSVLVTNNWMVGGSVTLGVVANGGSTTGIAGLGPFVRYYFLPKKEQPLFKGFFASGGAGATLLYGATELLTTQLSAGGGYNWFLTKSVGLELSAALAQTWQDEGRGGFANLNVGFGLQVVLGKPLIKLKKR